MDSNMDSNVINLLKRAFTLLNVSPNCHTINCCKCLTTPPQTKQTNKQKLFVNANQQNKRIRLHSHVGESVDPVFSVCYNTFILICPILICFHAVGQKSEI